MFARLVASAKGRSQFRSPAVIVGSVGAHAALLAGIVWVSTPAAGSPVEDAQPDEVVTYIDIADIPPPPDMVFEEPPADAPPVQQAPPPRQVAARPAATPRATQPAQPRRPTPAATPAEAAAPAGFQELRTPPRVLGIPVPDRAAAPVRAEDFGGRGQAGGTAAGAPPIAAGSGTIGTGTAAGTATGTGTGTGTGTAAAGPPTGTFSANLVDRAAALTNRDALPRLMTRLYPRSLADAQVEGSVHVQFVVDAQGRVDMSTVEVLSSTNALFSDATMQALREFRFRPARKGEHNVRMLTTIPIQWKLSRD
jgi:TonB family protein